MRVNVYFPDELGERAKAAGVNISAICQAALREALATDKERLREQEMVEQILQMIARFNGAVVEA